MVTPLQPKEFFRGTWVGEGELRPHPLVRWFAAVERLRLMSQATWLTETIWLVKDRFELSSGRVLERKMFCELVAPDRVHVTADDMLRGADIMLSELGFRFTPYDAIVDHRGFRFRVRCFDENAIDEQGFVHDRIKMCFLGFPVATMRIGPIHRGGPGKDV